MLLCTAQGDLVTSRIPFTRRVVPYLVLAAVITLDNLEDRSIQLSIIARVNIVAI